MPKNKILVVDDEKSMREFLEIMLRRDGYDVETAEGGTMALEKIEKRFFDAILRAKPATLKGQYLKSATLCSTMGPGINLDLQTLMNLLKQ